MKKNAQNKDSRKLAALEVEFAVVPGRLAPGTAVTHKGLGDKVRRSVEQMGKDFGLVLAQLSEIIKSAESSTAEFAKDYHLEEITVGLAFDANGKISFIAGAEAGVEASVEVTFKRKSIE